MFLQPSVLTFDAGIFSTAEFERKAVLAWDCAHLTGRSLVYHESGMDNCALIGEHLLRRFAAYS